MVRKRAGQTSTGFETLVGSKERKTIANMNNVNLNKPNDQLNGY